MVSIGRLELKFILIELKFILIKLKFLFYYFSFKHKNQTIFIINKKYNIYNWFLKILLFYL